MENQFESMKNELNDVVRWDNTSTGGDITMHAGSQYIDYDYYHTHWYPYSYYYPSYPVYEDKTKQAFKIVKLLMKKKLVKVDKVKDFVDLIDEVLEIL